MDKSTTGIRPENLSVDELVRYAYLELNENGLNKEWSAALIKALESERDFRVKYASPRT